MSDVEIKRQMRRDVVIYRISVTGLLAVLAGSFVMIFAV
jgi:hypothetical protein